MFKNLATNYQKIIQARFPFIRVILKPIDVDILKEEAYKLPPLPENGQSYHNVQYINDKFKPCRIGAFEIQLYSKSSGIQVIHSKLYTKQWPKVNTVLGKIVSCMPMFDLNLVIYDKEDYTEKEKMDGIQVNVYLVNNENIQEYIDNIEDDVGNVTNPGKRLETMKMTARMQKEGLYLNSLSNTNTRMQSAYTTNGSGRMMTFSARSNMKSAYRAHSTTGNAPSSSTARGGFKINCDLAQQKGKLIMRKFTQVEKEIESEDEEEKKEEVKEEEKKEEEKVNEEQPVTSEERKSRQESGKSQKSRQQSGKNQQMKSRQQTAKSKRTETNTIRESEENVNTKLSFTNLPYDTYIIETIENSNFTSSLTLLSFNSINRTFVKKQVPDPHDNNKPKEEITEENTKVTKYLGLYHQSKAILNIHLYTETEVAEPEKAKEGQMQVTTEKDTKPTTEQNKDPTNIEITPITSSSVTLTNINTSNKYSIIPNDRSIYEFKTEPGYYKIEIYDKEYESITKKINLERMKHILKVASLENLPDTRPLIAMNDDGDLKWLAEVAPSIEMVDLGLTSGTLWAKHNIGATCENTAESWYGGFYAWGETETKSNYSWSTYKFGASSPFSKYDTDGKTVLEAVDDVATQTYGSNYRMPTKAEIEELIALPNKWVNGFKGISGLYGCIFAKTQTELNGTFNDDTMLFIPAAGYFYGSTHDRAGFYCYLWSSSLFSGNPGSACCLSFVSGNVSLNEGYRYLGYSVRAVQNVSNS